jgi:colicin import membrane protein
MKTEIVKLESPELLSIEKSKAEQIRSTFEPMVEMLSQFENSYNAVISESEKGITGEITAKAKRLRIDIGKVRIETEKLRKDQKEEYLRAGKAIDGVANILKWAVTDKENKLKEIEDYFEIQEQKRLEALQTERAEMLSQYVEDAQERNLSGMDEDVWNAYFQSKKKEHEDRIEAERKAEEDRIAREKAEAEERERIRAENEKLKKEAELKEKRNAELRPYIIFIRDYNKMLNMSDSEYKKEFQDIKKGAEDHWEYERKEQIRKANEEEAEKEKQRKEREAYEAKIRAEREERERIQKELEAKAEAERKAREEEEARMQAELNKGDSDKVSDLINDLNEIKTKYSFKSKKNQKMYSDVSVLVDKIINYINQ